MLEGSGLLVAGVCECRCELLCVLEIRLSHD